MNSRPKVSILMSVYNTERFLRQSIDSMLNQTFKDFEFIIINDGSTDNTQSILDSYKDPRMLIFHQDNLGLTPSLNKAIDLARGLYIARMDADDISHPSRLEKQVKWLESHPEYCAVAAKVTCIDEYGNQNDSWSSDKSTTTTDEIRKRLPHANCLAHPSIMFRAEVLKKYRYNPLQKSSQDYDLWLRIYADGLKIAKIDEHLLNLRLHSESITFQTLRKMREMKSIKVKAIYLHTAFFQGKMFNWFNLCVLKEWFRECFEFYIGKKVAKKQTLTPEL